MAKIFSGLTLLVALAAIFFGFKTKELVEKLQAKGLVTYEELVEKRATLKATQAKLKATEEELAATKAELKSTQEKLAMTEADLAKTKTELADAKNEADKAKADYATINKNYEDLKAKFGGQTLEQIAESIAKMETSNKELTTKVAELSIKLTEQTQLVEGLSKDKKVAESQIAEQKTHIKRYTDNIMLKGTRGEVLAVNAGWGFCVLSLGDKRGAAANKILIVTRGGQAIGRVRIINVEASQSVADIIPSSFTKGTYVQPGDQVIYTGEDKVREEPAATPPAGNTPPPTAPTAPPLAPVPGLGDLPAR